MARDTTHPARKCKQTSAGSTRKKAPVAARAGRGRTPRAGRPSIGVPAVTNGDVCWLTIRGAAHNNLKNIDAAFPLGRFTCVTGVSGSGKSSLVADILYKALARELNAANTTAAAHAGIDGLEYLDKVIAIDQSPIGRTPRSNPVTYIKLFDEIRDLFAKLPDSKLRGYKPGRFSFNVATGRRGGGRCAACDGHGANRLEMEFLSDVWVRCPVCGGRRFSRETLQIRYKGQSIAEVLDMDVQQALEHFENIPRIRGMLQTLHDVGLDYIKLGQPSTTLSGGEAQRIKLARELVKRATGRTLYLLDEPTTGLHFDDIRKLLTVLHGFVDAGNTVVVIEHNLDVIKTADWLIDLGPEGGDAGGRIVVDGTPEDVAACARSYTGQALRAVLATEIPAPARDSSAEPAGAPPEQRAAAQQGGPSMTAPRTDAVVVSGARQHNLKDLTVSFPRNQITVCTGVSGSGKTSFAIDTVFTEGYRRYVESLSAYARQFLGQMAKPRVDHVHGLSPAICIEQKAASKSPRSTVGTITEIYDYLRVLWARIGTPYCPHCQIPVGTQTVDEICERVMALADGSPIIILAPLALGDGETYATVFSRLKRSGYTRVWIDVKIELAAQATTVDPRRKHRVEVVVDRTLVRSRSRGRISESVEHALALGNGTMTLLVEAIETVHEEDSTPTARGTAPQPRRASAAPHDQPALPDDAPRLRVEHSPQREFRYSQKLACTTCGASFEELSSHHFSFNSQLGWCDTCEGLGIQRGAPAAAIIRQPERSLLNGAVAGWPAIRAGSPLGRLLTALCGHLGVDVNAPLSTWSAAQKRVLMFGSTGDWIDGSAAFPAAARPTPESSTPSVRFHWRGFFPAIDGATRSSWMLRHRLHNVVTDIPCVACRGGRLQPTAAAVRLETDAARGAGRTIVDVCELTLRDCAAFFDRLKLDHRQRQIAGELLKEIRSRLRFLIDVGLDYLTLHRAAPTLSGGEAQRIRLASQIGSGLSGVLYVLDEPTIGLHPRDNQRLVRALARLRNLGNTLLLVEHDRDVIRSADQLLDFGPRAGSAGGEIVAQGSLRDLLDTNQSAAKRGQTADGAKTADGTDEATRSLTRSYLSGTTEIPIPTNRRAVEIPAAAWSRPPDAAEDDAVAPARPAAREHRQTAGAARCGRRAGSRTERVKPGLLTVHGARQHNLKNVTIPLPLGRFVCVTGVSGSGKSSLVNDIVWPALARELQRANLTPGDFDGLSGVQHVDKVINVDQSPIGNTPSSNPATYTGVFAWIRELFARIPDSKVRGYHANRFSFNRPGGRCEACQGYGQKCIEMHFMPDVWIECETCRGRRYSPETLDIRFKGKNIADVLDMRVAEALELFANVPRVRRMLQTLADVGLDYVQLGQPAPTLSGGEAQRVKLAAELGKPDTGRTFYILDEPTTGLHFDDIRKLLAVVHRLVDLGNTVLVVEHNLDVLKCADWIIDLGPEAGDEGGYVVAAGTPEELVSGTAAKRAQCGQNSASRTEDEGSAPPFPSHTAVALRPVLAAGLCAERTVFDPAQRAALELESERGGLGQVGRGTQMPWQVDGRRWHLSQRTSRAAQPTRWESAALEYVEKLVQQAGDFAPTNWNNRASVEITARGADAWFLHALTGGEWLLELYFHAPRDAFDWLKLEAQLGLRTLDERDDLPTYGDWARVDVRRRRGAFDAVVVYVHDKAEISTPGFRKFIKQAASAYLKAVRVAPARPSDKSRPAGAGSRRKKAR
ncbi:MAG: ATP-binding cassette domain-containing protein [Planctomycetes bacterium]|nr:ATP-binding cassette domain-containing protein [Planctomycetota bacterium]